MPRRARRFVDGLPYHVLNRGNRRQPIFSQHSDYEMFLTTMADAIKRVPIAILGVCGHAKSLSPGAVAPTGD